MAIKKGDNVYILSGKDRGKTAKVIKVLPKQDGVIVEGVNLHTKHIRPRKAGERGQRLSVPSPVHMSNVILICASCKKPARTRRIRRGTVITRVCVKCGAVAETATTATV